LRTSASNCWVTCAAYSYTPPHNPLLSLIFPKKISFSDLKHLTVNVREKEFSGQTLVSRKMKTSEDISKFTITIMLL
jgi:hypothetical protein